MADESRSIADVVQDIIGNIQRVIRAELRLAKTEISEEAAKAGRATAIIAAGGVLALYAFALLLTTILLALAMVIPGWLAALILFAITAVGGAVLLSVGKKRFRAVHPAPEKTIATVKENVQWAKDQAK